MVRLDIFSDPVCPWCYIGKACWTARWKRGPNIPSRSNGIRSS